MYNRILVATGGSPWSDAEVSAAIEMAARTGADLRVLTVRVHAGMFINPEAIGDTACVADIIKHEGQVSLGRAAAQAQLAGVACATLFVWGNVPDAILQTATSERCDLIIVGSRGFSGWKRLMLGSIANEITAKSTAPGLLVKRFLDA